jgi:hypothetical protein
MVPPFELAIDFDNVTNLTNITEDTDETMNEKIPAVTPAKAGKPPYRTDVVKSPAVDDTPSEEEDVYSPNPEDELYEDEIESEETDTIKNDEGKSISTASTKHKPYKTWTEFIEFGLEETPDLVSQFWLEHPMIIMNYMKHYIFTGKNVIIPYFWNPIDFICKPNLPPITNVNNTKYVTLNMFDVINQCQEALKHPKYTEESTKKRKEVEKLIRYTPIIADAKKHLETAEFKVRKAANQLPFIERKMKTLHGDINKEKLEKARMMLNVKKKQVLNLQRARDVAKKDEEYAIETVESMIIMFEREAKENKDTVTKSTDDEEEWKQMCKDFEMEEETNTNKYETNENVKVIDNNSKRLPRQVECGGHGTINHTNSQISAVTTQSNDTSTTIAKPVVIIEDIPFSECKNLFNKYEAMKQMNVNITTFNRATDAAVMVNPDTTSMLNHDTKEIVKITSNDLQRSECRRWTSSTTLEIFSSGDTFNKCIRSRPPLRTIESLKDIPEVICLAKKMELTVKKFQKDAQRIINQYMELEVNYHEKERLTTLEKSLKKIIRSHATKIVKEEEERRKTYHILHRIKNPAFNVSLDEVCGFTYLFLLTGPACTSLTSWSELSTPETMMNELTKTLSVPIRIPESEQETKKKTEQTINLGSMVFAAPSDDVWLLATRISLDMHELTAEFTLGSKTKFYNKIIDTKGNKAVRDLQYTKETIDVTAKVTKMLKNAKSVDQKLGLNVIKKFIATNTYAILNKRDTSIKNTSQALRGNKKKDNDATPKASLTTTIRNNNEAKSDTTTTTDESTAKRMRERRKEEEQRTNIIQQGRGGRGRGGSNRGGRGNGRGGTGRGRGIDNPYRRPRNTGSNHDNSSSNNKRQKH